MTPTESISPLNTQGWIAFLRVVVGAWFLKAVWTKLTVEFAWGVLPYVTVSPRFFGFRKAVRTSPSLSSARARTPGDSSRR